MPQRDSDNFTYTTAVLVTASAGKWTALSSFVDALVVGNAVVHNGAAGADVITTWSGSTTDQYSQLTLVGTLSGGGGPTVRSDAAGTFYVLEISDGANTDVYKCVAGSFTSISSVAITWAPGDTAYLEIQGTTIITKQNGIIRHNFTDASIASGKPGLRVYTNGLTFDDWVAGDFGGGGSVNWDAPVYQIGTGARVAMVPSGFTPPTRVV